MSRCDVCGNDYDKSFTLTTHEGNKRTFDSFECAIQSAAPRCAHCECTIIGHGVEADGSIYCCAHCAQKAGITEIKDRVHTS